MLIYVGEPHYKLITAVEGTGDNLDAQDIKYGYVDYWLSSVYEQGGEELNLLDSGQILTSKSIADMDTGEMLQHILEYWEATDAEYTILEH